MAEDSYPGCARCLNKECRDGKDCFAKADGHRELYSGTIGELHVSASAVEAKYYREQTRLGEVIRFAKELEYRRVGLAFCIGLSEEAKVIDDILSQHFAVVSVCCKVGGIDKKDFGLREISSEGSEVMCNPAGQADLLNRAKTELNIICGLCVGHDAIFSKLSEAPVTTLIVKDRVLAHNPAAAVYCQYVRRQFEKTV
jgi:uncharacterized metal-binding protein